MSQDCEICHGSIREDDHRICRLTMAVEENTAQMAKLTELIQKLVENYNDNGGLSC